MKMVTKTIAKTVYLKVFGKTIQLFKQHIPIDAAVDCIAHNVSDVHNVYKKQIRNRLNNGFYNLAHGPLLVSFAQSGNL